MTDALLEVGLDRCRRAGATVERSGDASEPPGIADGGATPTDDPTPFDPARTGPATEPPSVSALLDGGRPVAVEPLRDADPTLVLSRLWNDRRHGRAALFVVPDRETADRIERLLSPPVGARGADADGRTFYAGPDRVALAEGGYAAVPAGTDLEWRESATAGAAVGLVADADGGDDAAADGSESTTGTGPWLHLRAGGEVLACLDGVDALDCPSRERFPFAYYRDDDKQMRVVDFAGRPVQRYAGVGAMRDGGFRPVPAPLVPEHMFESAVDGRWSVVVAGL